MAAKRPYSSTSAVATMRECGFSKKKKGISVSKVGHRLLTSSPDSTSKADDLRILLNNIISPSPSSSEDDVIDSLLSLHTFFVFHPQSHTHSPSNSDSELRTLFNEFVSLLLQLVSSSSSSHKLREAVMNTIMDFVKLGNGNDGGKGKFNSSLFHRFLQSIVYSSLELDLLLESLASNYFIYLDVCYFTFITVITLCKTLESSHNSGDIQGEGDDPPSQASLDSSIRKIHYILSRIPPPADLYTMDNQVWSKGFCSREGDIQEHSKFKPARDGYNPKHDSTKHGLSLSTVPKKMKRKFTTAWMSFLRLPLPVEVYKEVLINMHQRVIPYLSMPNMLCDFLTKSYDIGGVVSIMALSGLFILMTKYGLEYPDFYQKLYSLLEPSLFIAKHRAKFFELLDACLKSPLVPAYLAAAFTKKLSRLSLVVPPSGALVIVALVHNLLRRHPSINCLVHQEALGKTGQEDNYFKEYASSDGNLGSDMAGGKEGVDVFNDEDSDPLKSNAMRSSLWEIDTLRYHYVPCVSRFVSSLENDLTVRAKTTEMTVSDFSSASYSTIFREEMRRRVKQVPLAFYKATPTALFSESDFPSWSFDCGELKDI